MLSNWTKATTSTTGTGTLTLSAVSGRPLPSLVHATGEYVSYSLNTSDGQFEAGIGRIAASDTLERTKVTAVYNGTTYNNSTATAISLSGSGHEVFLTPISATTPQALKFPTSVPTSPAVFHTGIYSAQANTAPAAAARATGYPFNLQTSGLLTAMGIRVGAAAAGATTLLGLYEVAANGAPGRRISKTSATIDTSTGSGTWKQQAVDVEVFLTPGWYWAAIINLGANPTFTGGNITSHAFGGSAGQVIANVREDVSASDLADPFPSTSLVYVSGSAQNVPYIGLVLT